MYQGTREWQEVRGGGGGLRERERKRKSTNGQLLIKEASRRRIRKAGCSAHAQ